MNERNDKMKFIDEYVCDALDMGDGRNPDQIYSDAVAEWEGSQTDAKLLSPPLPRVGTPTPILGFD